MRSKLWQLFCSLAVLNPRVGHTTDVLSPLISVLCHSDWLFHGESCPRWDLTITKSNKEAEVTCESSWCRSCFDWRRQRVLICRQWYEQCKRYQPHTEREERQHLKHTRHSTRRHSICTVSFFLSPAAKDIPVSSILPWHYPLIFCTAHSWTSQQFRLF